MPITDGTVIGGQEILFEVEPVFGEFGQRLVDKGSLGGKRTSGSGCGSNEGSGSRRKSEGEMRTDEVDEAVKVGDT